MILIIYLLIAFHNLCKMHITKKKFTLVTLKDDIVMTQTTQNMGIHSKIKYIFQN